MPANLENSAVATGLEKSVLIPIPKKGNAKECSNYHTIALISHTSKLTLKILQAELQQYMNREYPDVQAGYRQGRETRDQIANICGIMEKARVFQKTNKQTNKHLFVLYWLCQSLWQCESQLWKILKEMRIPGHLTCLLRNLYAGQVAWYSHLFQNFPQLWFTLSKALA